MSQVMEKRDDRKERWKKASLIEERNERNERAFITAFISLIQPQP